MRKVFLFGASSFLMKELAVNLNYKNSYKIICISRKKIKNKKKNIKNYTSDYSNSSLKKIFNSELTARSNKPIFIFGNVVTQSDLFVNLETKLMKKILDININLPINIIRNILKSYVNLMPVFINISSIRSMPGVGYSLYGSSKIFMENLFSNLALEYGNLNCIFKSIRIGIVHGGLANSLSEKILKGIFKRSANKNYVDLKEVINTIEYEFDKVSSNGKVIYCDNGFF